MSGVPWYLFDGPANAQEGIQIDYSKPEDIASLKPSLPGPGSNEYTCMIVRLATKNKVLRRKQITIEKLSGNPVLFIGTEEINQAPKNLYKLDSQIINIESHRVSDKLKMKKRKKRRRNNRNDRGSGVLARSIENISDHRRYAVDQLSQLQIDASNSMELCDII